MGAVTPGAVPVTVVVAARNAAAHVGACVASARWAGEILVVENDSTDDTVAVARAAGADVFQHPFTTIGQQRNAAIARARHEWILVLDADERCTPALATEIADVVRREAASPEAFRIARRNHFLGREVRHGGWERDRPVRLFRRTLRYDERPVHEHVVTTGEVGTLREPMLHYTYATLDEYFEKFDRYSRWWAAQHHAAGRRASALTVLVKPPARFLSMYVARRGFLDGAHGLVLAVLAAMSVGAKYARLWALGRARGTP